ncbi:Transcriptional regulator, LysR family [Candidatus Burkholderia crenata]|nr:Transcriptional regulator, LysR family [Candidatus Burkholderia crenata]
MHEIDLYGGVRAAADALAINGSVISRQVAQLERDHGVVLLERRGRRAVLTEIGLSLVEHFHESCRRDADMLAQLEDFRSLRRGRLGVGVGEGFVENLLATVLEGFSLQFSDIVVELLNGATSEIIAMVRNDDVDLGLCAGRGSDPAIRSRTFRAAQFCALVSPRHAAGERRIGFEQLRDQRLIFMLEHFGAQQYLDAIIRAERLNLTPSYRCDLFSAAQAIAAAGLGVAFMSTDAARQYLEAGRLVALELEHPIAREFSSQAINTARWPAPFSRC